METDKEKQAPSKSSSFVSRDGENNSSPKASHGNHNDDESSNNNHDQHEKSSQDHDEKKDTENGNQDHGDDTNKPAPSEEASKVAADQVEGKEACEAGADNAEAEVEKKDGDPNEAPAAPAEEEVEIAPPSPPDLGKVSEEIDHFISTLSSSPVVVVVVGGGDNDAGGDDQTGNHLPEIPECLEQFAVLVESTIAKNESTEGPMRWNHLTEDESASFLESINRVHKLYTSLWKFSSESNYGPSINRIGGILERAVCFLQEEFRPILEDYHIPEDLENNNHSQEQKSKQLTSNSSTVQEAAADHSTLPPETESKPDHPNEYPGYSDSTMSNLSRLAKQLVSLGRETECYQDYFIARRNALETCLHKLGFEKLTIDDVQKMNWEALEREIATWMRTFKQFSTTIFTAERKLAEEAFSSPSIADSVFGYLSQGVLIQLLNFAEAVAMTKRSSEKLFKFLDIYETLRDLSPAAADLFPAKCLDSVKTETSLIRTRLGETMISIFCELENSIKADTGKTPVPGGAVHPLTRYIMNYLTVACEYKETLEQVFKEHQKIDRADSASGSDYDCNNAHGASNHRNEPVKQSPFVMQLGKVMDLLDANLDSKSKLYKDPVLSIIFLMNNGRYILQKIKGSPAINSLMGDPWSRKRSSELRQYHTNYKRETWGKLLNCLNHEGLNVNGKVVKPVLKERFKSFNAMFDEIHRTQSAWVVSDEQLQSELRVSISAIVIPAYRSFMGRFSQVFTPGRQTEKYIKYQPEDIETHIDELFDGNTAAPQGKRRL